ncbi:alpha/beta fold hydrolase [Xanthobacter oligotrophicus]|uniref:alpha/beta fold hydrolase n=1 Tax=Xanthobacter oligotrophicus TaxID=2607286 RepID=UPI0011F0E7F9|nr:alpha/beta fold hydrolase [Xanthobacter oligotrophicus]MCG5238085.1 alpha/beta hydrolase [Xanthobacter oligotrophicus]
MAGVSTAFIATRAGAIECLRANPEADPARGTFVLLHGIQGTAAAWAEVAAHLGGERAIWMPNLRGRGRSPVPDEPGAYTLDHFATDLHAVIEAAAGPVTLVGWSMGVLVSLTYLDLYGADKLDALVLASGTARPGHDAVWFHADTADAVAEEARERAVRLALTAYATPTAVARAWASVRATDLREALSRIALPTLVMHGEQDDQCPLAHGSLIAAGIPDAALEIWPAAGHNLMAHDPERFAQSLLRHSVLSSPGRMNAI